MHIDPKAKKEERFRVNLDHYQGEAIRALAAVNRTQPATYLAQIIAAHLESFQSTEHHNNINKVA